MARTGGGELNASDIEIGAVEMKNATDDTRLNIATDDSAMSANPNIIPVGGEYRLVSTTYTDGDATVLQTGANGQLLVDLYSALNALVGGVETDNIGVVPFRRADSFQDISFDTTHSMSATSIKAATASKKHYITDLTISTTVAATVTIDDADGTVLEKIIFPAAGIFRASYPTPLVTAAVNKALRVTSSVAAGTLTVKGRGYTV